MKKIKTSELTGAALDWAVATAGEEWKTAHKHFPTMTLDPTFSGIHFAYADVYLTPSNPMRQDPQAYSPSTCWVLGGDLIEREMLTIQPISDATWGAFDPDGVEGYGATPLIAAMRCFVASHLGEEVEVPEVLG